jgi:IS6 family transposase
MADRSAPRHVSQLRCGSDHGLGWHAGDPHNQTRTWGGTTPILTVALVDDSFRQEAELMRRRHRRVPPPRSSFAGFRFPREVIVLAVRWYLRYGLSYRDVEELLAERGVEVDHVTIYRWVQRFTPLVIDAARSYRHAPGDRWFADETDLKVAGRWVYLYRAIDQFGQVIDVLISEKRDLAATRRFFTRALQHGTHPPEVATDRAQAYPRALDDLVPAACHVTEKYANNPIESDHSRLKSRLRPMRGLKQLRCARVISTGHSFVQNIRRGHYELGIEEGVNLRVLTAFDELTLAI